MELKYDTAQYSNYMKYSMLIQNYSVIVQHGKNTTLGYDGTILL